MKKKLLCFILFLFYAALLPAQDISGSWNNQTGEGGSSFTLKLTQISKNHYKGTHCLVNYGTNQIDCEKNNKNYTIALIRTAENIFEGSIKSSVSNMKGNFQLQYVPKDNLLVFKLTTLPLGKFYIPKKVNLTRS